MRLQNTPESLKIKKQIRAEQIKINVMGRRRVEKVYPS